MYSRRISAAIRLRRAASSRAERILLSSASCRWGSKYNRASALRAVITPSSKARLTLGIARRLIRLSLRFEPERCFGLDKLRIAGGKAFLDEVAPIG